MGRNGEGVVGVRARLLVAKGSFSTMGGAERDIIRNLPALSKKFEVSVATLDSAQQLDSICDCLLYTSPSPRDGLLSRMPSSA